MTDPYFLDRNLAAGADIFYIQRNLQSIASYSERRAGFALRAGYAFNERFRQTWSYSLIERDVYNIASNASPIVQQQAGYSLVSQLSQTLIYDWRDSFIVPRQGGVVRVGTDFAGIGGDVSYLRGRIDGQYYIPFEQWLGDPDYVLALFGSIGYLQDIFGTANTSQDRIIDHFFLGGENLRGFRLAGVGPRASPSGDALGGKFMWTQSTEFRYPLPGIPSELGLIGRAFVDVGALSQSYSATYLAQSSVFAGSTILTSANPRVGAGVGVSWRSPFGLINIDVAKAVVKEYYDQTQVFRFGFGTRF